jgi:hypothetical protein
MEGAGLMHIHIHNHPDKETAERLCRIEEMLGEIAENLESIMASFEELKAAQDETIVKIAAVKADVEKLMALLAAIPIPGMTPEQQAALDAAVTHATAINDALAAVDALNPET